MRSLVAASLLLLVGCKKDQAAPPPPPPEDKAELEAPAVDEGSGGAVPEEKLTLTKEKLDAFIKYQKKMLEVHATLMKDLDKISARLDAGASNRLVGTIAITND